MWSISQNNRFSLLLIVFLSLVFSSASCSKSVCVEKRKSDCVCLMVFDPVCGCNGKTYGNACEAECAGIEEYIQGECQ